MLRQLSIKYETNAHQIKMAIKSHNINKRRLGSSGTMNCKRSFEVRQILGKIRKGQTEITIQNYKL